jgi:nucleotide-binding universal stress UspA family protein
LIVPTDFSPVSLNAVNYAAEMAMSIDASLLLLNVYQVPVTFTEVPVVNISIEALRNLSEEKIAALKKNLEHVTSGKLKIYAESRLGEVTDEIEALCKKIKPFAVVMGTKGASGLERLFLGSNTLTAIRHLTSPVIVIPPGAVYNVDYNNRHFSPETPEESLLLHTMLEDLKPSYQFIDHPDIVEGIHQFAETHAVDMIITIPKKHKLLSALFQKSHTRELVFHAHIPIMCIHE